MLLLDLMIRLLCSAFLVEWRLDCRESASLDLISSYPCPSAFFGDLLLDQLPLCVSMARRVKRSEVKATDVVTRV